MKRLLKSILLLVILLSALTLFPAIVKAEDDPPIGDPGCNPYGYDAQGNYCPIDSNVYILLVIGALYGIKKVKDTKLVREVK